MNYVFDTSIILNYLKGTKVKQEIDDVYKPFEDGNNPIISIVTLAEIRSLALQNNWGTRRIKLVEEFLQEFIVIDVRYNDLIEAYAEIDAFSQNKLKDKPLGLTSRNMGKNDLWIAATASITKSKLLTADNDFKHLNKEYLEVITVN